jgi:hypothetical protein
MGNIIFYVPSDSKYLSAIKRLEDEGVLPSGTFDKALEVVLKKGDEGHVK